MAISDEEWRRAQAFESAWWGSCVNTLGEELKQRTYARQMGLVEEARGGHLVYDLGGRSVIDIGGGPASLLLKCMNPGRALVVEPMPLPEWVRLRYEAAGVRLVSVRGEDVSLAEAPFDEAWLYNVLQHLQDPALVVANARRAARLVRVFEWMDVPPHEGHPHTLRSDVLDAWLGGRGATGVVDAGGTRAYFGVFPS
jgi:hypothetical protein